MPGVTATSKFSPAGFRKWSTVVPASDFVTTDIAGNVFVSGTILTTSDRNFSAARLSPAGALVWQHRHTSVWLLAAVATDSQGGHFLAGATALSSSDIEFVRNPLDFTAPPPTPTAPPNLTATASGRQITLRWQDESGFRIERCTGANCTNFVEVQQTGPGVLAKNTTYTYRVRAFNVAGVSAYSNAASGRTGQ